MSISKVVLKGTGRMSLHERFTQLKFDQKVHQQPVQQSARVQSAPRSQPRVTQSLSRPYEYKPRPRSRTPDLPRYEPGRRRSISPVGRYRSSLRPPAASSTLRNQSHLNRNLYGVRSSTMLAANRIRKKSVYLRLGVRPKSTPRMSSGIPVWAEPYMAPRDEIQPWFGHRTGGGGGQFRQGGRRSSGGGGGLSRSASTSSLNRWNSQGSLNSYDYSRNWNQPRRNTWSWRGGRRNNYTNNTWNRWSYGGGGGRGRGSRGRGGRGRGGRGGGRRQPPPTREELDKELDSYMAGTKGLLDKEMDEYMANK